MSWPQSIIDQFNAIDPNTTVESEWYGPYNTLLVHIFKYEGGFSVHPQYSLFESWESIDFTTIYIVERKCHPVFILEIKPHPNIVDKSRCNGADWEIHEHFDKLADGLVIPQLHAVSLMGMTFATYILENATSLVMPQQNISSNKDIIRDLAPRSWWQYEILEATRRVKFLEIVEDVKAMSLEI